MFMCVCVYACMYVCRRLSDRDQDNALSQEEFCIAMKLVLMRRKGVAIPSSLPESLASLNLGMGGVNSVCGVWMDIS